MGGASGADSAKAAEARADGPDGSFQAGRADGCANLLAHDVHDLPSDDLEQLLTVDSASWSAGSVRLPDEGIAIILNPVHADTRKRASLMEELSHIYLRHKPSQIIINDHLAIRTFNKTQETQAYWVGAAALIPKNVLEHARAHRIVKEKVASDFGVSQSLVGFRENVTGIRIQ